MEPSASVLVVDDEANMRRLLRSTLRHAGFAVLEAESGPIRSRCRSCPGSCGPNDLVRAA